MNSSNAADNRRRIASFVSGPKENAVTSNLDLSCRSNSPAIKRDTACSWKSAEK